MKFPELPANPTNADLGFALVALHQCVEEGKVQAAKNRRDFMKLIRANRTEAKGWFTALESRVKGNEDDFGLWLKGDNERNEQFTTLLKAIGADKAKPHHKTLLAMSQSGATWRMAGVVSAMILAIPLAGKIINAIWMAGVIPAWIAVAHVILK